MRKTIATTVAIAFACSLGLAACERKGPAERAGEKIDHAAGEVKDAARETKEEIKEKAERAKEKAEH